MKAMNDTLRLELIGEAVRYCQRARKMGMPASCYTKALREPVYFLWTCRRGGRKDQLARYRSKATVGLKYGTSSLVLDHAIPFTYLQSALLELDEVTPEAVRDVLEKHNVFVLVTKSEHDQLGASGLNAKMPAAWGGIDSLARYKAVGIELVENSPML
jgi:hypothetical protein